MKKIKIGTIGNSLVGKTAICRNYLGEEFSTEEMLTVGMDKFVKDFEYTIKGEKKKSNIFIYDTSGQERYETTVFNFIKKCDGVLLVYAVTDKKTFDDISKWITKIRELQHNKDFPIILIGNKIDLENERVISQEQGKEIAKNNNFPFFETSAKTGEKVNEAFQYLINLILKYNNIYHDNSPFTPPESPIEKENDTTDTDSNIGINSVDNTIIIKKRYCCCFKKNVKVNMLTMKINH